MINTSKEVKERYKKLPSRQVNPKAINFITEHTHLFYLDEERIVNGIELLETIIKNEGSALKDTFEAPIIIDPDNNLLLGYEKLIAIYKTGFFDKVHVKVFDGSEEEFISLALCLYTDDGNREISDLDLLSFISNRHPKVDFGIGFASIRDLRIYSKSWDFPTISLKDVEELARTVNTSTLRIHMALGLIAELQKALLAEYNNRTSNYEEYECFHHLWALFEGVTLLDIMEQNYINRI